VLTGGEQSANTTFDFIEYESRTLKLRLHGMIPPINRSMTFAEVLDMVHLLAAEFGVATPSVRCTHQRLSYARFWMGRTILVISIREGHDFQQAALHEFAHAVRFAEEVHHSHDMLFYNVLKRTIAAWTGDPARYDWRREYKPLWRRAFLEGLTTVPAFGMATAKRRAAVSAATTLLNPHNSLCINAR
jgi:hypothetical protein